MKWISVLFSPPETYWEWNFRLRFIVLVDYIRYIVRRWHWNEDYLLLMQLLYRYWIGIFCLFIFSNFWSQLENMQRTWWMFLVTGRLKRVYCFYPFPIRMHQIAILDHNHSRNLECDSFNLYKFGANLQ